MLSSLVDRLIRSQAWLDPVGAAIEKLVGALFRILGAPGKALKTFLHGSWLGHALHPVLTDIPLGAWSVAIIADIAVGHFGIGREVGDFATFIGVLAAWATVVTGYTDFHETYGHERRVATAHGLIQTTVTILYTVSWLMRWQSPGSHDTAFWISVVAYLLLVSGAYLGGDLVFAIGTMVNRTTFLDGPVEEYVGIGAASEFEEGKMRKVDAGGLDVLVVRLGGAVHALVNTCSHAGGPLDEGHLDRDRVTCPWHASTFRVSDGHVVRGPSTFNQPTLVVRETAGKVEVRLPHPLHD